MREVHVDCDVRFNLQTQGKLLHFGRTEMHPSHLDTAHKGSQLIELRVFRVGGLSLMHEGRHLKSV